MILNRFFKSIFFILFFVLKVYCDNTQEIWIGLGYRCDTAFILTFNNLRTAAYPFDWMFSHDFVIISTLIKNHFDGFINRENLIFQSEDTKAGSSGLHSQVYKHKIYNGLIFNHFFYKEKPIELYHQEVKEKCLRRINRFFDALNSDKHVIFVRHNLNMDGIQNFCTILSDLYPALNYLLIVLCPTDEAQDTSDTPSPLWIMNRACVFRMLHWNELATSPLGRDEATKIFDYLKQNDYINNVPQRNTSTLYFDDDWKSEYEYELHKMS